MKRVFITYGDQGFESAKAKIVAEARACEEFDEIHAYGREDLSPELMASEVIKVKRGSGLWSWKPDVILSAMNAHEDGDIIVYCDAGCSLYKSKEWKRYWKKLESHDIIAQRIFQRTDRWTRKEILDYFHDNFRGWENSYQYSATIIIIISAFTRKLVSEWRNLMIEHPEFAMDVTEEERKHQHATLVENRHDQAIYSALIHKYLSNLETRNKIFTQWEHIEDLDVFSKQAIRATRLRQGQLETTKHKMKGMVKRTVKDFIFKPFYYQPLQWWYSHK